ncbi:MOSC domain-containing protein [Bacillus sp. V3B]|uniref:MOSC domain-containing protein n=1 Tax=Bacillus sp. V3B TaxID=2804915 RepID=UPI00210BFB7B|nr:MOSC domain-containing protein [Bacillus sp. V3B]MCQ6275919.1 MOSC domain-containing protein [Bacillus sp. V3B]
MTSSKVASIWRYPVKSMIGEELNACEITEKGLLGDRAYGVIDNETDKLANAKNPHKWPNMFQYRANFIDPPQKDAAIPPVRITFPDGRSIISTDDEKNKLLSTSFNRNVHLSTPSSMDVQFEGYIPEEIEELDNKGSIFTRTSPKDTFFDIDMVHIITTSTINYLRKLAPESRIEARRFRPNIIIEVPNSEAFIENNWVGKTLTIGSVQLKISQETKRCVMTTLAQGDLPKDPNVLRSIVRNNAGSFGVYASVVKPGRVSIGDRIEVD